MIPLVDLHLQHVEIADEVHSGWERVISSSSFISGEEVRLFELEFAAFCDVAHCVGVGNGTDALELALRAIDIGPGDEVLVPANSFIASAVAVSRTGATPVFVDVDPETFLIDITAVEHRISSSTKAIMPVHLYGQMAPIPRLLTLSAETGIAIIEDAAQAHGARQEGMPAGSRGLLAAMSFYPGKNLGAYGDAGAVLTESTEIATRLRGLRNYGGESKYQHDAIGFNSRLDTLQAVVLRAKLRRLTDWNRQRQEAATRYDGLLACLPAIIAPVTASNNEHVWHLFVVRVPERDRVAAHMLAAGIGVGVHYPIPIPFHKAYADLGYQTGDFPVAESAAQSILSLPIFPGITLQQQEQVVDAIRRALQ